MKAGEKLGPYEIVALLGRGGMGEVWRARDPRLNRDVAIKTSRQEFNDRFLREARAIAALNHPNICHLYDIGPNYLVMELVEGPTLENRAATTLDEALRIAAQIASALEAAHEKNITHRDLKPANIKLTSDGVVKVLDFGLARVDLPDSGDPGDSPTLMGSPTQVGTILGTAAYMAPEQARGRVADKRADIWAFGVVLFELLTGERLFAGETVSDVLAGVLKSEPDLTGVPARVRHLLARCLQKDPKKRLRDIGDYAELLDAEPAPPVVAADAKASMLRRLAWVITPVALAAAVLIGWTLHRRQADAAGPVRRFDIAPPEGGRFTSDGNYAAFALSPDGMKLAFPATGKDGVQRIWVRNLNDSAVRALPGTVNGGYPFWSPDGKSIGFFASGKLNRIELDATAPRVLCDAPTGRGALWLPDDRILFGGYGNVGLRAVADSGGTASPVNTGNGRAQASRWPQALPGGKIMMFALNAQDGEGNVYVSYLTQPSSRSDLMKSSHSPVYVSEPGRKDFLLWRNGTALVAQGIDRQSLRLQGPVVTLADSVGAGGQEGQTYVTAANGILVYDGSPHLTQFTWYDRSGRALGVVGEPGEYHFNDFRISPDGRFVAASRDRKGGAEMVVLEVDRGIVTPLPLAGNNGFPNWFPDSRRLSYGNASIVDTAKQAVLPLKFASQAWDQTHDGHWAVERKRVNEQEQLMIQTLSSAGVPEGEQKLFGGGMHARFSPDAHWLAYDSVDSGGNEVYVEAFPNPSGRIRISVSGGQNPIWHPDGRELFYVAPGNQLMSVSMKPAAGTLQPSAPKLLFVLPVTETPSSPYDVAKDGRFLVRADVQQVAAPLKVILNWESLVK